MRWVATLVTAVCLLAANGVRPTDARTADRAAHLATVTTSHLAARPHQRLAPFALPEAAPLAPPPSARALGTAAVAHAAPAPAPSVPRSRGPPLG